jgi:hypothetical protein
MTRPIKQIGDEIRELTDAELVIFYENAAKDGEQNAPTIVEEEDNDAPVADSSSGPDPH